jgi:beta-lactamase class D
MLSPLRPGIVLLLSALSLASGQVQKTITLPPGTFGTLTGSFVLYDAGRNTMSRFNPAGCATRLSPASTFKIPNSLIGLETGVIPDEHFVIPWDSVRRSRPEWNRNHDLASAIAGSVVWYYQELARRVGTGAMQKALDALSYGNRDISGGIDRFWLGSSLEISADEQVEFLRKLARGTLPFSRRTMEIVRRITILEQTPGYTLHGKTGFADMPGNRAVGWFVGWVEKGDDLFCFACNLTTDDYARDGDAVFAHRKEYAISVLRELGVLPRQESK